VLAAVAYCVFMHVSQPVPGQHDGSGGGGEEVVLGGATLQTRWQHHLRPAAQQLDKQTKSKADQAATRQRLPSSYSTLFAGERGLDAVLFLSSVALHHPGAHVYISSDSNTYEWFLEHAKVLFYRLNLHWSLALDKYNMRLKREEMEASNTWNDFMLEKVGVMETALRHHNDTMLLDADFVLLEPVFIPLAEAGFQVGASPHYMKKSQADRFGLYNGGMLWTNQVGLGDVWRQASAVSRYYEQAAIEDLTRQYPYFEFGPEHNVGFWRAVHDDVGPKEFYSHLYFDAPTQMIKLRNQTVATFHTHVLTRYPWEVGNKFSEAFVSMLRMSRDLNYERIASVIQWANDGCIPPQMVV
jgi:hypothetical protein